MYTRLRVWFYAAGMCLLLSACGGGGGGDGSDPSSTIDGFSLAYDMAGTPRARPEPTVGALEVR